MRFIFASTNPGGRGLEAVGYFVQRGSGILVRQKLWLGGARIRQQGACDGRNDVATSHWRAAP